MNTHTVCGGVRLRARSGASPELVAARCLAEIREALHRCGRSHLRARADLGGLRLTLGVSRAPRPATGGADLPPVLRSARPATRRVFRQLRDLRAELGAGATVFPRHIVAALRAADPSGDEPSADTVNHALRDLRDRGLAWSHPERGWALV
ncbi:hypothetical protein [Gemmata sp.]|uniref:hypothetical protein n=1 Tax=Gemmata sp. TaxID=1914242 RepID=UPI003F7279AB